MRRQPHWSPLPYPLPAGWRTIAQLRAERLAAGVCIVCADSPPERPYQQCRPCLDWAAGKKRERKAMGAT